jgi:hypothetical protein
MKASWEYSREEPWTGVKANEREYITEASNGDVDMPDQCDDEDDDEGFWEGGTGSIFLLMLADPQGTRTTRTKVMENPRTAALRTVLWRWDVNLTDHLSSEAIPFGSISTGIIVSVLFLHLPTFLLIPF